MKVLFAVNNESISEAIVKKYQKEYKEIISYKNVYYFNAILKEIQKDKSYDRIVISEELEQFTNSSYEQMDKFIFDRLDSISDEATNLRGEDIPIILICSERRGKSDPILIKLFGIGIYNAMIGADRSIDEVCRLIQKPRLKKEAKLYYRIDSEEVGYQAENENDVSEIEIQNILAHYKRLGKDEDKYIESFDNIAAQYNDNQLRIISKFLPLNVRAVLEERSPKYQKVMSFNNSVSNSLRNNTKVNKKQQQNGPSEKLLKSDNQTRLTKPVVIPSAIHTDNVTRLTKKSEPIQSANIENYTEQNEINENDFRDVQIDNTRIEEPIIQSQYAQNQENENQHQPIVKETEFKQLEEVPKKRRGRPRKNPVTIEENVVEKPKRGRGRPKKIQENVEEINEDITLPGMNDEFQEQEENISLPGMEDEFSSDTEKTINTQASNQLQESQETMLPGFEFDDELDSQDTMLPGVTNSESYKSEKENVSTSVNSNNYSQNNYYNDTSSINSIQNNSTYQDFNNNYNEYNHNKEIQSTNNNYDTNANLSSLLTGDKKVVSFVGTTKNGTSFVINNVAQVLASMGINTAIFDTTQNRNSYYIYTKNEEDLRKVAFNSINNLKEGRAEGIKVNRNLTVYTSLPDEKDVIKNSGPILETLVKNYSVVLIDCDFSTPDEYFSEVQEIYLVQSMDVLTIQPLTAFLRGLKAKNILNENKLKIVINKYTKIRSATEKTIIGGMAFYNDPAMSFMTELFDRNMIKYTVIPFEEETYMRYLEGLINCDISLKGYSKNFMQSLKQLANMIYPLVSGKGTYKPNKTQYNGGFSSSMNNTLNQMKQNY